MSTIGAALLESGMGGRKVSEQPGDSPVTPIPNRRAATRQSLIPTRKSGHNKKTGLPGRLQICGRSVRRLDGLWISVKFDLEEQK